MTPPSPARIIRLELAAAVCLAAALLTGCGATSPSASSAGNGLTSGGSAGLGTTIRNPVPAVLRGLPLTNLRGQRVDLASWPGRTVLLVPFLTLCQDVCPLTTGNLLQVEQSLRADHAASKVQIVELTVDPGRDTPTRLAAYAKLTHSDWQLVTTSPAELAWLAKFFGFYYQKAPEEYAAFLDQEISFQTKQPLLVVMPTGDGLEGLPRTATVAAASLTKPAGSQSNDLARAAITAVPKLAAAGVGRVPTDAAPRRSGARASTNWSASVRRSTRSVTDSHRSLGALIVGLAGLRRLGVPRS